jgi:hypothetical protein
VGVYMEPRGRWTEKVWEALVKCNGPNRYTSQSIVRYSVTRPRFTSVIKHTDKVWVVIKSGNIQKLSLSCWTLNIHVT